MYIVKFNNFKGEMHLEKNDINQILHFPHLLEVRSENPGRRDA